MAELRSPLSRVLDGPALLVQRLTAFSLLANLRGFDPDQLLLAMAETDPDYLNYLDTERLTERGTPRHEGIEGWQS